MSICLLVTRSYLSINISDLLYCYPFRLFFPIPFLQASSKDPIRFLQASPQMSIYAKIPL